MVQKWGMHETIYIIITIPKATTGRAYTYDRMAKFNQFKSSVLQPEIVLLYHYYSYYRGNVFLSMGGGEGPIGAGN